MRAAERVTRVRVASPASAHIRTWPRGLVGMTAPIHHFGMTTSRVDDHPGGTRDTGDGTGTALLGSVHGSTTVTPHFVTVGPRRALQPIYWRVASLRQWNKRSKLGCTVLVFTLHGVV